MTATPGSLVSYREREWVVLPSRDPDLILLRPIGGSNRETCGVIRPLSDLIAYSLPYERIQPAQFPRPEAADVQDLAAVRLVHEAARLLLRDGAAPFRSLGHLSFRPRAYQFVPLLMALRQQTIRLLIADDVGVGKTIEAGLIARELLDRGEITRLAVLCPPYLCDQWQRELHAKFHIEAVVVRSGTIAQLERATPPDVSIFAHYPFLVASIDLVKGDRYRTSFLQHCPELVLVDEVHGAAQPPGNRGGHGQQQRHQLLLRVAEDPTRHLILLSATPHSGIETSFLSILGLLNRRFRSLDLARLGERDQTELAKHFVQRRRRDIAHWLGEDAPFPVRNDQDVEEPYHFSRQYIEFYNQVYSFVQEMVRTAETLTGWRQRMRFWSALALLRCVSSSPAAAEAALRKRAGGEGAEAVQASFLDAANEQTLDEAFEPVVYDPLETEIVEDAVPSNVFETQEQDASWGEGDRRRLRAFAKEADKLRGDPDNKLLTAVKIVGRLIQEGFHPIVWCRYIATASYVTDELQTRLGNRISGLKVSAVTGALSDEERHLKVEELGKAAHRVLVATDCLSEGINLQEHFDAVIHYDLPWNPNRLEQREGRVDRFGQPKPEVRVSLIFGQDNPVDGAVLDVLLRKAREIRRDLGIHVPVPVNSETIMEAVLRSLFARSQPYGTQLSLFDLAGDARHLIDHVREEQERAAQRERESRTRFAQHSIQPEEVHQELGRTDTILGNESDVRRFLQEASQRVGFALRQLNDERWELGLDGLPPSVRLRLPAKLPDPWPITFKSPTPPDLAYIGRNHPLVEGLAEYLLDLAFHPTQDRVVSRCGVIRTAQVTRRTTLFLLRLRYLQYEGESTVPLLSEETLTWGFQGDPAQPTVLELEEARRLFDEALPVGNLSPVEKRDLLGEALAAWNTLAEPVLRPFVEQQAHALRGRHLRGRAILAQKQVRIEANWPPDLLGIVVLLPQPKGVRR